MPWEGIGRVFKVESLEIGFFSKRISQRDDVSKVKNYLNRNIESTE